ncbi:hypothetical protein WMY93_011310 [Mugilogobius chulae]|uniref:Syndecan n=1 Tax=Mugilogobius chulae TaxID=88201 RepID=A0AAW0PB67_9GOBI
MLKLFIVLILSTAVISESVRETETWMPMKTTQKVSMSTQEDLESSGDSHNGSDFGFTDDEDDDDDYSYDEFSGSGDGAFCGGQQNPRFGASGATHGPRGRSCQKNEISVHKKPDHSEANTPNVLMSHTTEDSIFNKTEVLAALIAGGAVGLMFAVLLILLLIYRMKKKDEGSYELGKKPIYKKAPTTEIYA